MDHECPWCLAERGVKPEAGRHEVCALHALACVRTLGLTVLTPYERDRYFSVRELAAQSGMSEDYWRARIKAGDIAAVDFSVTGKKGGADWRVSRAVFRAFCEQRSTRLKLAPQFQAEAAA